MLIRMYPYAEIVGSLLYLAVVSRNDIMYAVSVLTPPQKSLLLIVNACRILNYLSHHPTADITCTGCKPDLHVYTDTDQ